jgi:type III restriction enzyme
MLHTLLTTHKKNWLSTQDCPVRAVVDYIRHKGELRDAQIEAIETWLFLKISGGNKPLWQLFSEGFFNSDIDLSKLHISQEARDSFQANPALQGLFEFARQKNGENKSLLPELEKLIIEHPATVDAPGIFKQIFYNADYPDYLFSLPMGAGKTFLMAALMYLDLYFAGLEPDNPVFARNFIILVPSGLKSSIIPSLKTIEKFDPSWVIPEPAASTLKKQISFEVLDQSKSAKKSNRARNPNAQKIARHQPFEDLVGLILVVNAEKVILDRLDLGDQLQLIEHTDDEKDRQANELRNLIGKIPNLSIHIDEVHHAATDDIKLRQVVNRWSANGSLNSVIGYSGTPYLSSADSISISADLTLKFAQITNTVYYYPLVQAIQRFLKKPRVEIAANLEPLAIIEKGVRDFHATYWNTVYGRGTCAKLAIYCGSIPRLEEDVLPLVGNLVQELGGNPTTGILKYHKGNKEYKLPKDNELAFNSLDLPHSKVRIILLVQVGKEGWDCRSLTGVILAQKGDSPTNMVLQTSCRCLRQVDKDTQESAVIWLNDFNAKTLNAQLKEEQQTSIAEINNLGKAGAAAQVERFSRMAHLKLPTLEFRQLRVEYEDVTVEDDPNTGVKLDAALNNRTLYNPAVITRRGLNPDDPGTKTFIESMGSESATFRQWLSLIVKESFNTLTTDDLLPFQPVLQNIFTLITFDQEGAPYFNELYDQYAVRASIRLAFHKKRELRTQSEIVPEHASLLVVEKLDSVEHNDKLYPSAADCARIREIDQTGVDVQTAAAKGEELQRLFLEFLKQQGKEHDLVARMAMPQTEEYSHEVKSKDRSFHYLPYDFHQSGFELNILREALTFADFQSMGLELYYNGEQKLTEFRVKCFERKKSGWKYVGLYTPDFLLIQRKENVIHKALIIETKGSGFADQIKFKLRRNFMETEFLWINNESFGYERFEFLYLPEDDGMPRNLAALNTAITTFFKD